MSREERTLEEIHRVLLKVARELEECALAAEDVRRSTGDTTIVMMHLGLLETANAVKRMAGHAKYAHDQLLQDEPRKVLHIGIDPGHPDGDWAVETVVTPDMDGDPRDRVEWTPAQARALGLL